MLGIRLRGAAAQVPEVWCGELIGNDRAESVKSTPAMQETRVRFLGREDPQEKEVATHSNILAWTIPWTEALGRSQSTGSQELDMTE